MTGRRDNERFMIMVVCDGNICRSPLLELALRQRLPGRAFGVRSAGLTPLIGHPMDLQMQRVAAAAGLDPVDFRAAPFEPRPAGAADLVLTMSRAQRDAVIARAPRLLRRTMSVAEAVINFTPEPIQPGESRSVVDILQDWVRAATARRSTTRLTSEDDIPDPYRGDDALFDVVGRRLLAAADELAPRLCMADTAPPVRSIEIG